MRNSKVIMLILAVTVTVSGCSINGGDGSQNSEGDAIAVERFEVAPQTIYAGSDVSATLNVRNVGNTEAEVNVGEDGRNVMTSYTPDLLRIESFSASSSAEPDTQKTYNLRPDETLSMNWDLNQFDEDRVRFYADQQIDMSFRVPFSYTVEAYQQFQIKEDEEVESLEDLGAASSNGPLDIHIQMIGSSSEDGSPVFLEDDDVQARIEFRNQDTEEGDGIGLIDIEPPTVEISGEELDDDQCNAPDNIQVQADSSTSITCQVDVDLSGSSAREEVTVSSDYNFTKTVSKDHITVKTRG